MAHFFGLRKNHNEKENVQDIDEICQNSLNKLL